MHNSNPPPQGRLKIRITDGLNEADHGVWTFQDLMFFAGVVAVIVGLVVALLK